MGTLKQQLLQCKHLPVATMANFQLISKNEAGDFTVPDGWSFVRLHEMGNPEIQGAMGSLFTGPEVVDEFNKGNMKLIRKGGRRMQRSGNLFVCLTKAMLLMFQKAGNLLTSMRAILASTCPR